MDQSTDIAQIIDDTINELGALVSTWVPKLITLIVILLIGYIIARIVRAVVTKATSVGKIGETLTGPKVKAQLKKTGMSAPLPSIIGKTFYWLVFLLFLSSAAESIGLSSVKEGINSVFAYIPNVISASILLGAVAMLGKLVNRILATSLQQMQINFAGVIANIASSVIILFGAVIALAELGFDTNLLTNNITVIVAGAVAILVLGVGLGSRVSVENIIAGYHGRQVYSKGQKITHGDIKGKIKEVTSFAVVVDAGDTQHVIPFSKLMK